MSPERFARAMRAARCQVSRLGEPVKIAAHSAGLLVYRADPADPVKGEYSLTRKGGQALNVPPKRGRPPLDEGEKRCIQLVTFTTPAIAQWLAEAAQAAGMTQSAFTHSVLEGAYAQRRIATSIAEERKA